MTFILMGRWPDENHHSKDVEPPSLHPEILPYHIDYRNKSYPISQLCKTSEAQHIKKITQSAERNYPLIRFLMTRKPPWYHPQAQKGEHCPCGWRRCVPRRGAASGRPGRELQTGTFSCSFFRQGISSEGRLPLLWCTLVCWDHSAFLLLSLVWCLPSRSLLSEKHLLKDLTWAISRETLNTDLTGSSQWRKPLEVKVRGGASQKGKCKLQDKDQNGILSRSD